MCAFPTAPEGQDYITWLWNERKKSKALGGERLNGSTPVPAPLLSEKKPHRRTRLRNTIVRMSVQFPKSSNITSVVLVACLHPLGTLPDTDEYLIGKTMSKASAVTPIGPNEEPSLLSFIGKEAKVIEITKEQWRTETTNNSWNAEGIFAPRAWSLKEKMSSVKSAQKIAMLHKPVSSLENSSVSKHTLATLRVLLLTTTTTSSSTSGAVSAPILKKVKLSAHLPFSPHHEYTVVSAIRSTAFTLGSTRSLRQRSDRSIGCTEEHVKFKNK